MKVTKQQDKEVTVASLSKDIEQFAYRGGYQAAAVFDDMLRYIIYGFSLPTNKGLDRWEYKKEENRWFYEMAGKLVQAMQKEIDKRGWFDALGGIYEDIIASKSRRSNSGQFLTPPSLCDLMTEITVIGNSDDDSKLRVVGDPTCGSGRTLLSYNAKFPGNFYIAEDIDETCAMMTVVNFLYHGIRGEVVWHDSLAIEPVWGVWRTNFHLNNPFHKFRGIPHIEPINWENAWLKGYWSKRQYNNHLAAKLQENVVKLENRLRAYRSIANPAEPIKTKIAHLSKSVERIKRVIGQKYS